jgi:hypothetical protein
MVQLVVLQEQAGAGGFAGGSLLLLAFFWAGFIFLNGKIAKWKGYPFWAGAVSGIVLFWGTILFLVMPFNQKKKNTEEKSLKNT